MRTTLQKAATGQPSLATSCSRRRWGRARPLIAGAAAIAFALTVPATTALALGQSTPTDQEQFAAKSFTPSGGLSGWRMTLNENFSSNKLNESIWNAGWLHGVDGITPPVNPDIERQCYGPDAVSVSGGQLDLDLIEQNNFCAGIDRPLTGGMIQSYQKATVGPGSFIQARIKTEGSGTAIDNWPAFWLNGESHDWPRSGEIDVMEGQDNGRACWHVHTPSNNQGGCIDHRAEKWHTYGAHWRSDGNVDFYYDYRLVGTQYLGTTDRMYLIVNLASWTGVDAVVPSRLSVDYIRTFEQLY